MLEIDVRNVDEKTLKKYNDFSKSVEELIKKYEQNDGERLEKVASKMGIVKTDTGWKKLNEKTSEIDWDMGISIKRDDKNIEPVPISLVLAYEYCLATERITGERVKFDDALNELFKREKKFRIGNPEKGRDDQCLYGKTYDDETAVPVTAKAYRVVCTSGAQHLSYFQNGELNGAVFLFSKEKIDNFAIDENGKSVSLMYSGIEFDKVGKYGDISLLTYFRQTAFHEWTHSMERDFLNNKNPGIDETYIGKDGKKYKNYQKVQNYTTSENIGEFEEEVQIFGEKVKPEKVISYTISYPDETVSVTGKRPKDGWNIKFRLEEKHLDEPLCISSGLETVEITPEGIKMHNQVTEGFVEATARAMVLAIDPETKDLDEGRYFEKVEMAKKVFEARDSVPGNGKGKTYADFLTHSAVIKKELEAVTVTKENGSKVDGLHYISDYANDVHKRITPKRKKIRTIMEAIDSGKIDKAIGKLIKKMDLSAKDFLTPEEKVELERLAIAGGIEPKVAHNFINGLAADMEKEKAFFDGIPEKLGYRHKDMSDGGVAGEKSSLIKSAVEATEESTKTSDINNQISIIRNRQIEKMQNKENETNDEPSIE